MNRLRNLACLLAGIGVLSFGLLAGLGVYRAGASISGAADAVAVTVRVLPGRVDALTEIVRGLPSSILPPVLAVVDARAQDITVRADGQITALRADLMPRVDIISQTADKRLSEVTEIVEKMRLDVTPILAASTAMVTDAQASWDDLYWDVKASVESGTVTMHSVAVASEAISAAAPKLAASGVEIGKSIDGIAGDVKREADEITAPKKWWQKVLGPVYTVGRLVAAFL